MVTISEAITKALQAYQTRNWFEAEWICQQILELQSSYVPALHLLGAIAQQTGRLDSAIAYYQQVIAHDPQHFEAYSNLAIALHDRGDLTASTTYFQRSLALNPHHAPTHFNFGNVFLQQKNLEAAIAEYQQAIRLNSKYVKAYNNLGTALREQGNLEQAIACYQQVVTIDPGFAEGYNNLGNTFQMQGQLEAAVPCYIQFLTLRPQDAKGYCNLGNTLRDLNQFQAAIAAYQDSLQLEPDNAEVHNNLGIVLQYDQQPQQAIAHFQQAIALQPTYAEAHSNLGILFQEQNRLDAAIAHYQQAITLNPEFAQAHANLGMGLLLQGDFQRGFAEYEWCQQCSEFLPPSLPGQCWDGSNLQGQTILLYADQGLGDAIQFIRYVPQVVQQNGRILVECPLELHRLFETIPGIAKLIARGQPLPQFDRHVLLTSLPHLLNSTLETIPNQVPYLSPPDSAVDWIEPSSDPLRLGIVWASGKPGIFKRFRSYQSRTASLPIFMELLTVPGVELYSLQVGIHAADIAQLGYSQQIYDLSHHLKDFADTAAAIAQLDLIISVDTAVAHLAGALGKPVWVLLPFAPDWRWMLDRDDSPWYPTMRLFRQEHPGDWEGMMKKVVAALTLELEMRCLQA
jgi:tetratricopeptide (TPR) repeat protein